jgi:hypothetical protein
VINYDALATAFCLLHGNPPKSLRYRNRLFSVTDRQAAVYRARAELFMREQCPVETNTIKRLKVQRNKMLRALYHQHGLVSK